MRSKLPSPALVLSLLALVLASSGAAVAAVKISGKQIKDGSITGRDIKNDSLTGTDIKGQTQGGRGARGPGGPAGPRGASGGLGPVTYRSQSMAAEVGRDTYSVSCPDGLVPTGGGAFVLGGDGATVEAGRPAALQPGDDIPDSWQVLVANTATEPVPFVLTVICTAAPGILTADSPR